MNGNLGNKKITLSLSHDVTTSFARLVINPGKGTSYNLGKKRLGSHLVLKKKKLAH